MWPTVLQRIIATMRVIVGRYRGRKLVAPEGETTRPILDRVKQALFDRLGARWGLPGEIPPFDVLDLYAGSGSLGIEALSRGARFCCFVETDASALECLRRNLTALREDDSFEVITAQAERAAMASDYGRTYSLVFLDPPYPLSGGISEQTPVGRVMARLGRDVPVSNDALLVWRVPREVFPPNVLPGGWLVAERHDYGTMSLLFLNRPAS